MTAEIVAGHSASLLDLSRRLESATIMFACASRLGGYKGVCGLLSLSGGGKAGVSGRMGTVGDNISWLALDSVLSTSGGGKAGVSGLEKANDGAFGRSDRRNETACTVLFVPSVGGGSRGVDGRSPCS